MSQTNPHTRYAAWYRHGPRHPWRKITVRSSEQEVMNAALNLSMPGGDWLFLPAGRDPNLEVSARRRQHR